MLRESIQYQPEEAILRFRVGVTPIGDNNNNDRFPSPESDGLSVEPSESSCSRSRSTSISSDGTVDETTKMKKDKNVFKGGAKEVSHKRKKTEINSIKTLNDDPKMNVDGAGPSGVQTKPPPPRNRSTSDESE